MRPRLFVLAILVLVAASAAAQSSSDPATGLTTDFRTWLTANGYGGYHFERSDVAGGAYGGRTSAGEAGGNPPGSFIPGHSDTAPRPRSPSTRFFKLVPSFKCPGPNPAGAIRPYAGPRPTVQ